MRSGIGKKKTLSSEKYTKINEKFPKKEEMKGSQNRKEAFSFFQNGGFFSKKEKIISSLAGNEKAKKRERNKKKEKIGKRKENKRKFKKCLSPK